MNHCTVVCTGNSLRGFDFKNLHGYIIAVNWAFQHIDYDICVARDSPKSFNTKIPRLETLNHHGGKWESKGLGVAREPYTVAGYNCTVITALNIAIQLGYKRIYLLGADNRLDEYLHFYDDKKPDFQQSNRSIHFFKNVEQFFYGFQEGLIDEEIITVESSLPMFKNITLEEYTKVGEL